MAKPARLHIRTRYVLLSGTFPSLENTNLSSLVAHIPKEEETQVLINIIKC